MTEPPAPAVRSGVRSVHNALTLVEALATRQPVGVSELARVVELPKSSVQRALRTLEEAGWAETCGVGAVQWRLTRKVFRIGLAGTTSNTLVESARAHLVRLRDTYGETVHLTVPDGDHLIVIARIDGTNNLRTFLEVGTQAPMVGSAGGRCMLAVMPAHEAERLLRGPIPGHTPSTLRDPEAIRDRIRQARETGYATNEAEWRDEVAAVAAPVVAPDGTVLGAVSLSMPAGRYRELDIGQVGADIIEACRRIGESVHHRL